MLPRTVFCDEVVPVELQAASNRTVVPMAAIWPSIRFILELFIIALPNLYPAIQGSTLHENDDFGTDFDSVEQV